MAVVDGFIGTLETPFVQQYLLPLLLVFVILYGVLESVSIFQNNRIDGAIAIIGSLLIVTYTPFVQGTFQAYVVNIFGSIAMILVAILAFLMLTGMLFGQSIQNRLLMGKHMKYSIMAGAAIAVFLMFLSYGGSSMLGVGLDYVDEQTLWGFFWAAVGIGVVGSIMWSSDKGDYEWELVDIDDHSQIDKFESKKKAQKAAKGDPNATVRRA